jgi:hypothetical protein
MMRIRARRTAACGGPILGPADGPRHAHHTAARPTLTPGPAGGPRHAHHTAARPTLTPGPAGGPRHAQAIPARAGHPAGGNRRPAGRMDSGERCPGGSGLT